MNLKLDLTALSVYDGHAMDYMKTFGIRWAHAISVPLADAWWFCECSNVPDPLPSPLTISYSSTETIMTFGDVWAVDKELQ